MKEQATLVIIKPDGIKKSLVGNIISRLSEARLKIIAARVVEISDELAKAHYHHLADKPFFGELIDFIQGKMHGENRVIAMVYWGEDAIQRVRTIAGATNPEEADPVSIRGAYGRILTSGLFENVIHASSDESEAEREIKLWFDPEEIARDLYPSSEAPAEAVARRVWS